MRWSNQDPRESINKRSGIAIWAPESDVFRGDVETKHGYYIALHRHNLDQRTLIAEDDSWPPEWMWIYAPANKS